MKSLPSREKEAGKMRPLPVIAAATALALVAGGGMALTSMHKSVALDVDGQTEELSTFAGTVEDVLEAEDIELGEHDVVAPSLESDIEDGTEIVVRYAQQLNLEVDGDERTIWSTALTADEAVSDLERRGSETAILASRSDRFAREAKNLPLLADTDVTLVDAKDESLEEIDEQTTVGGLLEDSDIELDEEDELKIHATDDDAEHDSDLTVTVTRIKTEERESTKKIDFETVTKEDDSMYEDERKVVKEGKKGKERRTHEVLVVNGDDEEKELLDKEVVKKPVDKVIHVGTKERPEPEPEPSNESSSSSSSSSSGSSSSKKSDSDSGSKPKSSSSSTDGLNWDALAQCESGGNPSVVSPNGLYHGLYQFSVETWKSVGGSGLPSEASPSEQTARAKALYERSGPGQWPVCGKNL